MAAIATLSSSIPSNSSARYTATIVDPDGNPIPDSSLDTLVLSLFDSMTGEVLNGIENIDILNTDRGVVTADGLLTINFLPADMAITPNSSPANGSFQYRSAVISWTYDTGNQEGRHQVNFKITVLAEP